MHDAGVLVLDQEMLEPGFAFFRHAIDDRVVLAIDGVLEKLVFQRMQRIARAGKNQQAGGIAVEAMDEVDVIFAVLLLEILGKDAQDRRAFLLGIRLRQQAGVVFRR